MGEYIKNSFEKGLNKDLSKSKVSNNTLYENNFDITTELGLSTLSLETPKGNKYSFSIPDTYKIFKITINELPATPVTSQFNINGQLGNITVSPATDIENIYNQILTEFTVDTFKVQLGLDYIYIIGVEATPIISSTLFNTILNLQLHIDEQKNLAIIGWKQIRESIVVWTTEKTNIDPFTDPLGNPSQIWKLNYDDVTNNVISNGFPLNSKDHLYYNDRLNLSLRYEIYREAEGRYENTNTQRVYWTDEFNRLRSFNFGLTDSFTIPIGLIDVKPNVNFSIPIVQSIIPNGGSIPVGKIAYAYQLQSADGALTPFSPISNLIELTDSNVSEQSQDYKGAPQGTNSNKAVRLKVNNIDLNYDIIIFAYVIYQVEGIAEVYKFSEFPITSSTITIVHSGNEVNTRISLAEFTNPNIQFDTCKTLTYKYNRLYPANTTTKKFKLNFDARAYRFSGNTTNNKTLDPDKTCRVYSQNGTYKLINTSFNIININGTPVAPQNILDKEDLVNPYNDESGSIFGLNSTNDVSNWEFEQQYKYQTDGITLGGEGSNVKYKFITKSFANDYTAPLTPSGPGGDNSGRWYGARGVPLVNVPTGNNTTSANFGISGQDYPLEGYDNLKAPLRASIWKTFPRGEVFRAGIVCKNDKGEESFVEWISDIRIPEGVENPNFKMGFYSDFSGNRYALAYSIGIEFEISNLPADITSVQIVFVERTDENKTRFGTGLHLPVIKMDGRNSEDRNQLRVNGDLTPAYVLGVYKGRDTDDYWAKSGSQGYNRDENTLDYGVSFIRSNFFTDPDFPSSNTECGQLGVIKSPMIDANIDLSLASYIKLHETSYMFESQYFTSGSVYDINNGFGYWLKHNYSDGATLHIRNNIKARQEVNIDSVVSASLSPEMQHDFHNVVVNNKANLPNERGRIAGLGQNSEFIVHEAIKPSAMNYPATFNSPYATDKDGLTFTSFNNIDRVDGSGNPLDNKGVPTDPFRIVQYCRFNIGQYGGPWRSSRYTNEYISFGNFVPKSVLNTPQTIQMFGDTYIGLYHCVYYAMHWIKDYDVPSRGGVGSGLGQIYSVDNTGADMKQASVVFVCESPINTDLRYGKFWADDQVFINNDIDSFAPFQFDENLYNNAYNQQNNLKKFIPEPFNVNFDEEQPHRVWVSQNKLDSEVIDSWKIFKVNDYKDLEGTYGPINKIVNFKDRLIAYQDRATAWVQSEENSALQTNTDLAAQIGTGDILTRYQYISTESGTIHQHSVIVGPSSVHAFDARLSKYTILDDSLKPASDIEGLSAFFREKVQGDILVTDQVLLGLGIHGVYDTKFNRAYMTFLNRTRGNIKEPVKFTVAWNDLLQCFEKDIVPFTPELYLCTGKKFFSNNNNDVYLHSIGNFNEFYGTYYPNKVSFFCKFPDPTNLLTARVDTIEFWSEVFDNNGINVPLQSITSIIIENDYQSTVNSLNPLNQFTLKQRERTWRIASIKDHKPPYDNVKIKPYLRDKYVKVTILFDNPLHRLILHDVNTQITKSYH